MAVPPGIATELLVRNRHACCVCQKPHVQIHHIDGDPANNDHANLAVVCLEHHDLATQSGGLSRKLSADELRKYKSSWEQRCQDDLMSLARERLGFYAALYKNPPRIREHYGSLTDSERRLAVQMLLAALPGIGKDKVNDEGYRWQVTPRNDGLTEACLASALAGEIWPSWLPRVRGHPEDSDYPDDMAPPDGLRVYHTIDLYYQILVQLLVMLRPPVPLERIFQLTDIDAMNSLVGSLVSFREQASAKNVASPKDWRANRVGEVRFRVKREGVLYRTEMAIRNMYVFSDTAPLVLQRSRVSGIGLYAGASSAQSKAGLELRISVMPLLLGIGSPGQSVAGGSYDRKAGSPAGSKRESLGLEQPGK